MFCNILKLIGHRPNREGTEVFCPNPAESGNYPIVESLIDQYSFFFKIQALGDGLTDYHTVVKVYIPAKFSVCYGKEGVP